MYTLEQLILYVETALKYSNTGTDTNAVHLTHLLTVLKDMKLEGFVFTKEKL